MKTAKQINDEKTGQIEPMVITKMGTDGKIQKVRPYTHPLTCQKCHRVINTQLCAVCENETQGSISNELYEALKTIMEWVESGKINSEAKNTAYGVMSEYEAKWLKIIDPMLPQE